MRLDKLLANKAYGSRKEVHQLIKDQRVTINGEVARKKIFMSILSLMSLQLMVKLLIPNNITMSNFISLKAMLLP